MKLQRRIYAAQFALAPFLLNSWVFKNDKALLLDKDVPLKDRNAFSFDFLDEDVEEYFRCLAVGGRRYLLKESDESLPAARRHRERYHFNLRHESYLFLNTFNYAKKTTVKKNIQHNALEPETKVHNFY